MLDEEVPLAVVEEEEAEAEDEYVAEIEDEDTPLSDNPETGDVLPVSWLGTAATALAGLVGAKKKKEDK